LTTLLLRVAVAQETEQAEAEAQEVSAQAHHLALAQERNTQLPLVRVVRASLMGQVMSVETKGEVLHFQRLLPLEGEAVGHTTP
jgi:hypothetical protein